MACVISIGHWTDAISILSCTVCRYAAAVDTRTCSAPERCVLKCTCTLPGVRITAEREVHQSVDEGGSTVHVVLYAKNHATSAHVRQTEQADGVCLYRVQQRDVRSAIGLRSWRNRSRCVLSTDEVRPSHDGVSNTILLCGQMRILTPVERNLTLRSGVCVCVWTISSLVIPSLKAFLQERHTRGSCRTNCPDFWKMCLMIDEVVRTANTAEFPVRHVKSSSERSLPLAMVGRGSAAHHWPSRSAALMYGDG